MEHFDASRAAQEHLANRAAKKEAKFEKAKLPADYMRPQHDLKIGDWLAIIPDLLLILNDEVKGIGDIIKDNNPISELKKIADSFAKYSPNWSAVWSLEWKKIQAVPTTIGDDFVQWFLEDALGVKLDEPKIDASEAKETLGKLASFLFQVPFIVAGINFTGRLFMGDRWEGLVGEELSKFTEELGLNWMMGTLLETIFEQAVGRPLEEVINIQKLPNRLDMMTLRALARQHHIKDEEFNWELTKQGYPENLRTLIKKLDESQLPVTDIQAAWLMGTISRADAEKYFGSLGYSDADIKTLMDVYINHASTQADTIYRDTARTLFTEDRITESQFVSILNQTKTPKEAIKTEVAAIQLQKQTGRLLLSVATIHKLWQENIMKDQDAESALIQHGYNHNDASDLIQSWREDNKSKHHTITSSKVLQYLVSGIMSPQDAYNRLISLGFDPQDASFLVAHPSAAGTHHPYTLKPTTVIQAYEDGIIDLTATLRQLSALNVNPIEQGDMLKIANWRLHNKKVKPVTPKALDKADIHDAFKEGIIDEVTAESMLEDIGYSSSDAHFVAYVWLVKQNPEALTPSLPGGALPQTPLGGGQVPVTQSPSNAAEYYIGPDYKIYTMYDANLYTGNTSTMTEYIGPNNVMVWIPNGQPVPSGYTKYNIT